MAQHDLNIANQSFPSFRSDLNNALSAIQTTHSGTSRPTGAVAGQIWLDTTSATSPTLKYYDGADDISLATIDHSANTVNWLDSTVSITGLTTTATGTVLTLSDTASTSTVNLIIDNQKEVRFRETTANGTNYIGLKAPASVSADLTFTLPATDGTSGQALVTNGSGVLSFTTISAGTAWQSVQTTGFTAVSGRGYPCNTTSSAFTVTLPATPSVGDYVQIVDYAGTFDTNKLTIDRNGSNIQGSANNVSLTGDREGLIFTYIDSTQGWLPTSAVNEVAGSFKVPVDFLIVAGGGGGGSAGAGGGGAGGYLTGSTTFNSGQVITVTVGAGGAGGISSPASSGTTGSDSLFTGSTTALGGGGGGQTPGKSGGSGGGGSPGGAGTSGQGNNGGNSGGGPSYGGGGGGGAGAVGSAGTSSAGGNGGNGLASSITGSSVAYAGGGGGAAEGNTPQGTGGSGGGGNAGAAGGNNAGIAGTANTGGGGGGGHYQTAYAAGGAGGSGIVVLSLPTSKYSGTTTGSPTVTTSGSNTIIKFTASGSYTA